MSQELLDRIKELKGQTNAEIDDLIDSWEELAQEFDVDDDSTDEPRLYCNSIADTLTEVSDELSRFKPSRFRSKVGMESVSKEEKQP